MVPFFVMDFVFLLFGFLAMYFMYRGCCRQFAANGVFKLNMLPFLYIYGLFILAAVAAGFLTDNHDFVEDITWWRIVMPLAGAAFIYLGYLFFNDRLFMAITASVVILTVYIQPLGNGRPFTILSEWELRLLISVLAVVYCLGNRILNLLPHIFIVPQIMVLLGLVILSLIGAVPVYVGICAAMLAGTLGAYLALNYYKLQIEFDDGACVGVSYLTLNLLLLNMGEYSFPSCVILTTIFWAELLVALWNKYILRQERTLAECTNYYLGAEKYNVNVLVNSMVKINIVILFLSWFQLFSVNQYSLMIIALALAVWLNGTVGSRLGGVRSLKQINKDFMQDLKQNITDAKNALSRKGKK